MREKDWNCDRCGTRGVGTQLQEKTGLCAECRTKKNYEENKHECPDCGAVHRRKKGKEAF